MNQQAITNANALINSKANYVGGGMEGCCTLSLLDEQGYPTTSTLTIARADGINWLTFATSPDSNKALRMAKDQRASVCLSSSEYNVTLVGTVEQITDPAAKADMWFDPMSHMWTGPEDPNFFAIRFTTERYNLYFAADESEAVGTLCEAADMVAQLKVSIALSFRGQCNEAIALYEKAFGATVVEKLCYGDANPADFVCKPGEEQHVFYGEIAIGNQLISVGDDSLNLTDNGTAQSKTMSLLVEFASDEQLKVALDIISEGATILEPLNNTSYCTAYVVLQDKFGIRWDLMSGYEG